MTRFGETFDQALDIMGEKVSEDLSDLLKVNVVVSFFTPTDVYNLQKAEMFNISRYDTLEDNRNMINALEFTEYQETPYLLKQDAKTADYSTQQYFHSSLLKSNCRVTNQPDWGDVYIYMKSHHMVSPKSLVKYIVSFRDENHFHEEICETIYKRLWDSFNPKDLSVTCLYARRGGIDINPSRASSVDLFHMDMIDPNLPFCKTPRQ